MRDSRFILGSHTQQCARRRSVRDQRENKNTRNALLLYVPRSWEILFILLICFLFFTDRRRVKLRSLCDCSLSICVFYSASPAPRIEGERTAEMKTMILRYDTEILSERYVVVVVVLLSRRSACTTQLYIMCSGVVHSLIKRIQP